MTFSFWELQKTSHPCLHSVAIWFKLRLLNTDVIMLTKMLKLFPNCIFNETLLTAWLKLQVQLCCFCLKRKEKRISYCSSWVRCSLDFLVQETDVKQAIPDTREIWHAAFLSSLPFWKTYVSRFPARKFKFDKGKGGGQWCCWRKRKEEWKKGGKEGKRKSVPFFSSN